MLLKKNKIFSRLLSELKNALQSSGLFLQELKRFFVRLIQFSWPRLIYTLRSWPSIIGITLALSGFWNFLGYFSPQVDLDIMKVSQLNPWTNIDSLAKTEKGHVLYEYDLFEFRKFYMIYEQPFPSVASKNDILKELYFPEDEEKEKILKYGSYNLERSDIDFLVHSKILPNLLDGALNYLISKLEEQLDTLRWRKGFVGNTIGFGSVGRYNQKRLRNYVKSITTDKEYYTYLCALLYSRRVENDFRIENKSEIPLEDITIMVRSPESKLAFGRSGNIVEATQLSKLK